MALPQACPVKEFVMIESFHSSLKSELFYSHEKQIHSTSPLKQLIHNYIEYYNTERIQEK
ncbi:IS3 family transposase [Bacillus cereus]|uniref:IS3 family transposase n=1 Tax=Bacillus cereus TaxID=1396 RepID=UPI000995BDC3